MTKRSFAIFSCGAMLPLLGCSSSSNSAAPGDAGGPIDGSVPPPVDASVPPVDAGDGGIADAAPDAPDAQNAPDASSSPLTISLDGYTLYPPFSPGVHDYVIPCVAGTNATVARATAPYGSTVLLTQPQSATLTSSVPLSIGENDAVVFAVIGEDGDTDDYWVRCLPHDFPQWTFHRYKATTPGWYVMANVTTSAGESSYGIVFDGNGVPVWYRKAPTGTNAIFVDAIGPDTIVFYADVSGRFGTNPSAHFDVIDIATGTDTPVAAIGSDTDEHEFLHLANGDDIVLSYPPTTGIDMSSRGITNTTTIADCNVQEIAPDGGLVFNWLGSDHMDVVKESTELAGANLQGNVAAIDPFHCNSVDVNSNGDLLISARQADAVMLVSRATGTIVWKLGGLPFSKDGAQLLQMQGDPEGSFYHQHDARFLPNGGVSLYDDHTTQSDSQTPPPNVARGMEIALDLDAGTGAVAFQYAATTNAAATGSYRSYADGSKVIGWGFLGTSAPALAMTEVDSTGTPLLDLSFVNADHDYRALKVPQVTLDIGAMRRTAGSP